MREHYHGLADIKGIVRIEIIQRTIRDTCKDIFTCIYVSIIQEDDSKIFHL